MAEDTCEITEQIAQQEEEEEVSPEFQNAGHGSLPSGNLLAGVQVQADASMINEDDIRLDASRAVEVMEETAAVLGFEGSMRASAVAHIATELDIVLIDH